MPELTRLLDLTSQVQAPDLDQLGDLASRRRRRATTALAGGLAAAVAVAAVAVAAAVDRHDSSGPIGPGPTPTVTTSPEPSAYPTLTAEQIRDHPDAKADDGGDYPVTAADVAARLWTVCLGDCSRDTETMPGEYQSAFEVSRDGFRTGAVYLAPTGEGGQHVVDDQFLLNTFDGVVLVDSRGRRRPMELGAPVAIEEIEGPLGYSQGGLSSVDLEGGFLHPVKGKGYWEWQGAGDSWYWGVALTTDDEGKVLRQAAVWRDTDGTYRAKVLPIPVSDGGPGMLRAAAPGTMAVVEHFRQPRRAHVSTDYGRTWQVREVPGSVESGGRLPADWDTWPTP